MQCRSNFFLIYYKDLSNLLTFRFDSAYPEEIKTPEDFSSQEEFYEHIYQECEHRHSQLISEIRETIPTGMGRRIFYCANMDNKQMPTITYLFRDNFRYYYPDPDHVSALGGYLPVTFADWDEETREKYSEFENKIYKLAADKFKAAYKQAANYPFLN